jgi:hypothetical protein
MSQKETTNSIGHLDAGGSPQENRLKLAEQARQAYEQKRTKDCLDLTRAILLIDPDNTAAHWMRSSIQSEMHRDLENASAFLRKAQSKGAENQSERSQTTISEESQLDWNGVGREPLLPRNVPSPAALCRSRPTFRGRWLMCATVLIALGLVVAGLARFRIRPNPVNASPRISTGSKDSRPIGEMNAERPLPLLLTASEEVALVSTPELAPLPTEVPLTVDTSPPLIPRPALSAPPAAQHPVTPEPSLPLVPAAPRTAAKLPDQPVIARATGILAVSSPTSIDIYQDGNYIGSAPVSLELPSGVQTLEYRHGSLSKKVTHQINGNETTRAMITFDVNVQINSKPWAEVFLDGVEMKGLGQTPLSGVRVPIGSVLVFENPGFPKKKYRVTGTETGIQAVFP